MTFPSDKLPSETRPKENGPGLAPRAVTDNSVIMPKDIDQSGRRVKLKMFFIKHLALCAFTFP